MIMIVGGAYQGKRDLAKQRFGFSDSDIIDGGKCKTSELINARCIEHYELAIKRMISEKTDVLAFTEKLNCEVVIMNEIGCGIIPLGKNEREWREVTGRAGCIIAGKSETVYRVCCGIATVIKGEKI